MGDAEKTPGFNVGDSVVVKQGTIDPDLGIDIGGWQGRVLDIEPGDSRVAMVAFQCDSITLKNMPDSAIERCEVLGLSWTEMTLSAQEVEPAAPRDTKADVAEIVAEFTSKFAWSYLGEQGERIRDVLTGVDTRNIMPALKAWETHLKENLAFPFRAEVDEYQSKGPLQAGDRVKVTKVALVDDHYGVIVDLRRDRREYAFPLRDLAVVDKRSPNYQIIDDYRTWYANR